MTLSTLSRLAGASALTLALAACMDISMTVDVTSQTEAEATVVTSMANDIYQMVTAQAGEGDEDFCAEGELVQNPDKVDCIVTISGTFEEIEAEGDGPQIQALGGGQVRVAFPTGELAESFAEDTGAGEDAEMQAMIASMFEGHSLTMAISGGQIVDTNMTIAADGRSASYVIPIGELFGGGIELPEEIFAIVQK